MSRTDEKQTYVVSRRGSQIFSFLLNGSKAVEIHCDACREDSILDEIYIGKVQNIVKNISAAFVEIAPGTVCYLPLEDLKHPVYTKKGTSHNIQQGDELLVPTPDYPLWTAVTSLAGAKPVHYLCDEEKGRIPNIDDIRAKVGPRTKGIVVINPNNPTGVLYPNSVLLDIIQVARENGLVILADEVYDKILYDGIKHTSMAALSHDVLTLTFNSLSKAYRACGYRAGWMVISGDKSNAKDFIEGLNMLANMKLCANVPGQYAIQTALGGYQSINDLICEGGRLRRQRDIAYEMLSAIPGVSVVHPCASLYMFPRLDPDVYPIEDDREFFKELLEATNVVLVQGTGFNWPKPDHFRMVFLPYEWELRDAINRIAKFLADYRKRHPGKKTFPEDSVQPKSKEEIARQAALAEAKDPA